MIFADVAVRVSPRFRMDFHIDLDEANAAGLSTGDTVEFAGINGELFPSRNGGDGMEWKQMVRDIARELLRQMEREKARKPGVLFIFCDSTAHEPFQDQFTELRNAGIGYDMLFLDGETSAWLNMHRVESTGSTRVIAADEYAPAPSSCRRSTTASSCPKSIWTMPPASYPA